MEYKKGDRVRHPTKDDWGLGKVLADSNSDFVRVFFVGAGEKTLALKYVQPMKVLYDEVAHPILDNLKISKPATGIKYQGLAQSIQFFCEQFPGRFYGQKFYEHEREYKDKAHPLAKDLLGNEILRSLLEKQDYAEVARRSLKVVNPTNLIFPNEKMALKDGLATLEHQREFAVALYEVLFGEKEI